VDPAEGGIRWLAAGEPASGVFRIFSKIGSDFNQKIPQKKKTELKSGFFNIKI
jgi:hypothetical protein